MISGQSLHNWAFGIYGESWTREVDVGGADLDMEHSRVMAYAGYDILPGVTFYVTGGMGISDIDDQGAADGEAEYGAGLNFNLFDHEILDPTVFDDRIRINGCVQGTYGSTEYDPENGELSELKWQEVYASLTLAVVNDCAGNKFFAPMSISLFVGPVYSAFLGGDVETDRNFGVTAGMEVFCSLNATLTAGVLSFGEDIGYTAGLHLRF